jgi:hypothetical protein
VATNDPPLSPPLSAEMENLCVFYRTMTNDQLWTYRSALVLDLREWQRRKPSARSPLRTAEFCRTRIFLIDRVLDERGEKSREG